MFGPMRAPKPDRYDYLFAIVGVLFTYAFLVLAKDSQWSWARSIILLIVASIPVGIGLARLKARLQSRRRNGR
jgi:hypothetical protein